MGELIHFFVKAFALYVKCNNLCSHRNGNVVYNINAFIDSI